MIRTEKVTMKFPQAGWLGERIKVAKTVLVSRIKRKAKPTLVASPEQKQALKKHFSKEKSNG